jgi:hypothetical protein
LAISKTVTVPGGPRSLDVSIPGFTLVFGIGLAPIQIKGVVSEFAEGRK